MSYDHKLPSLNALKNFETAARFGNFKQAATNLGVTSGAISHQIKLLEKQLGFPVFDRHRRGVSLTEQGQVLFSALQFSFDHILTTVEKLQSQSDPNTVTVSVTTAVSSLWLTPRLARFWKKHGNIAINQIISDHPSGQIAADIQIIYANSLTENDYNRLLFKDRLIPLCSPAFAKDKDPGRLQSIAKMPLVHLNTPNADWTTWQQWFGALGYTGNLAQGINVNNYSIALQAACDDMGLVLGWKSLVQPLVDTGALVPFGNFEIISPASFYLRLDQSASKNACLFRDWLLAN